MSPSLKLIEQSKVVSDISTNWACLQSDDNRIAILSVGGVYIWELSNIKNNTMTLASYKKKLIEPSKYNPCLDLGINTLHLLKKLTKEDLYEVVLRTDITPMYAFSIGQSAASKLKHNTYYPINCYWSPEDVVDSNQCVLAVLSHYFSLNVYRKLIDSTSINNYVDVCNVSKFIVDYYKTGWSLQEHASSKEQLEELKYRIRRISVLAATWTNLIKIENEHFFVLIVALSYGNILFLKFPQLKIDDLSTINLTFLGEYTENFQQISYLHWVNTTDKNNGFLYFGTFAGTISCVPITNINLKNVQFSKQFDYLSSCDNISVTKILHSNYKNYFYLFITKRNNFIIILSNLEGIVMDIKSLRIGTLQINGVNLLENNTIMLVTQVGIVKELRLSCIDDKLNIIWKDIYVDMNWKNKKCHGWFISKNQAHFGFLTTATQMRTSRHRLILNSVLSLYVNRDKDLVKILQENKTSLKNYWDSLETIRICTLLDKHDYFSSATFKKDYNEMSLLQLKTNFWLSYFYEYIKTVKEDIVVENLKPSRDIMCIINIKIAVIYLSNLLYKNWTDINDFQKQSIVPSWIFLKEMVAEDALNKLGINEPLTSIILNIFLQLRKMKIPEPLDCLYCGEKLINSSCIEKHHDCRCGVTKMQILQAKFICPICKCPVHEYLQNEFTDFLCPFCDVPLEFVQQLNRTPTNIV